MLSSAVELKAASFTLPVIRLCSCNLDEIAHELNNHIAKGLRFFKNAPVVIDLESLNDQACSLDFIALAELLRSLNMVSVGVRHADSQQKKEATAAGLAVVEGGVIHNLTAGLKTKKVMEPRSIPQKLPAHIIRQTVRSGQQIHTQGRDVIILATVNAGAEIVAEHNIHVYGSLRGRAFAGTQGDKNSRIFVQSMEAELVSIAGHYQVSDDPALSAIHGMPAHFFLQDDQLAVNVLE